MILWGWLSYAFFRGLICRISIGDGPQSTFLGTFLGTLFWAGTLQGTLFRTFPGDGPSGPTARPPLSRYSASLDLSHLIGRGQKTAQKKTNSWERRFPGTFRTNVPLILPIFSVFSVGGGPKVPRNFVPGNFFSYFRWFFSFRPMFFRYRRVSRYTPPKVALSQAGGGGKGVAGGIAAEAALWRVSRYTGVSLRLYRLSRFNGPLR